MKKWMTLILTLAMVLSLFAGFAMAAQAAEEAGETEEATEATDATEAEEDYEGLDRIGEETEEGYKIKLTNATGSDIMGLNIQTTTDDTWVWSDELLAEDDTFESEEVALFCYTPGEEEDETSTYNVQIVFTDWTVGFLHAVSLSDMTAAEIHRAPNSLPYLVYTSLSSEEEVDTSEAEQAVFEGELASGFWSSATGGSSSGGSSGGSGSGGSSGGANTQGCQTGALFN